MRAQVTDLAEFLLARIAEDEAAATHAGEKSHDPVWEWDGGAYGTVGPPPMCCAVDLWNDVGDHVARWDPARVLAECEAKRRIVELHSGDHECSIYDHHGEKENCAWVDGDHCSTLRLLAYPYGDHPDYDKSWKP